MIVSIRAFQDKGKTALAVKVIKTLLEIGSHYPDGFRDSDIVANILLPNWPGAHCINNNNMRQYINQMVVKGLEHKIIFVDEADRVFPARFWQKPEQTEALIGLWQDYKLFNVVLWTAHEGTGVDIILRDVTQIEITPEYQERMDRLICQVYNAIEGRVFKDSVENISSVFPDYNRWDRVV
jgi:hypothetical protein